MEIILIIIGIVVILIIMSNHNKNMQNLRYEVMGLLNRTGKFNSPKELDDETVAEQLFHLGQFTALCQKLPQADQIGLKAEVDRRQQYWMELMLEMQIRHGQSDGESLAPILQRTYELIRQGLSEEEAKKQAVQEYVVARDAKQSSV